MYLNTSDISAFVGQTKWDIVTPFERLWKNNDSEYSEFVESVRLTCDNQQLHDMRDTGLNSKQKLEKYIKKDDLKILNDKSVSLDKKKSVIADSIQDKKLKLELSKDIESVVNTEHGVANEEKVVKLMDSKNDVKIDRSNKLYKKLVPGTDCVIVGRVDGLYDNPVTKEKYIVEIKNRVRGFFPIVKDYENTQIQTYLWLLEGYSYAILEEHHDNKSKSTRIEKDPDYLEFVFGTLTIFINNFQKFINDDIAKTKFLKSTQFKKGALVRKMYKSL